MARSRGLVWAMEELEEQAAAATAVPEEPLAVDSLETDILEVNEDAGEIDDLNASIEEAVEDVDTLEDIASVMDESTENGGMDQTTARVAEIAVESIYKRLGVQKKTMPAMESFGGKGTRVGATKIAVEGVTDVIKAVWEKIAAAGKKVWGWITSFLDTIINTAGKLKDRAVALAEKVKGLVGKKSEQAKVDLGSTGASVAVDGKADAESIKKGAEALVEFSKTIDADAAAITEEVTDSKLASASESEEALNNLSQNEVKLSGFTTDGKEDEDGCVTYQSAEFPGGSTIEARLAAKGKRGKDLLEALSKQSARKNKKSKGVAKEEYYDDNGELMVPVATPEQLATVCEKVGLMAKTLEASKKAMDKAKAAGNSFLALVKSIGTKIAKAAKDVAGLFQRAFSRVTGFISSFFSSIYSTCVNSGKACLDWVEKHYAAYKAKKSEKAEAAAA